jgi:hypothetical protein
MQSFSTWVRRIATGILLVVGAIFTGVVFPVVSHFIQEQPQETANVALKILHAALKFLYDLSEQTWLRVAALLLVGFVAGLWVDWLLRKLDGSRANERKALGTEMVKLGNLLHGYSGKPRGLYMPAARPRIVSCFTTARKLGIWVPDDRMFSIIHFPPAMDLITDYLMDVGTMLQGGHFSEAKQHAESRIAGFDQAYAEHGFST